MTFNTNPDPTYPKPPAPVGPAAHEIDPDLGRAIGHLSAALGHPTVYGKTGPYGLFTATIELAAQRLAATQAEKANALREFEVYAAEIGLDLTRFDGIAAPWRSVETSRHWQTWRSAIAAQKGGAQ